MKKQVPPLSELIEIMSTSPNGFETVIEILRKEGESSRDLKNTLETAKKDIKKKAAKKLKQEGISTENIQHYTKLSKEEIEKL